MRLRYLSHRRPAKAQASLRMCAVLQEPLLFPLGAVWSGSTLSAYNPSAENWGKWRYHQDVSVVLQAVPGPGKYDIKGIFEPEPPKVNTEGVEVEHPPFMSQAKVR